PPRPAAARTRRPSGPSSAAPSRAPRRSRRAPPRRRRAARGGLRQRRPAAAIPRNRPFQALVELDLRLEAEELARLVDVRDPQLDVCVMERLEHDLARATGQPLDAQREV